MPVDILDPTPSQTPVPALSATTDIPAVEPAAEPTATPPVDNAATNSAAAPTVAPAPVPAPSMAPDKPVARRMAELTAQRQEAEATAAAWEKSARELKATQDEIQLWLKSLATPATPESSSPNVPAASSGRPRREDFAEPDSYDEALIEWAGKSAADRAATELRTQTEENERQRQEASRRQLEAEVAERQREQEQARLRTITDTYTERRAAAIAKYPDYLEKTELNNELPITKSMAAIIALDESGPEIAYWLANHTGESARIAAMVIPGQFYPANHPEAGQPVSDFASQALAMGRIAAGLRIVEPTIASETGGANLNPNNGAEAGASASAPTSVTVVSSAPAPPTRIPATNAAATSRTLAEMSMEEYAAARGPIIREAMRPGGVRH
jgi:hypothetical protein